MEPSALDWIYRAQPWVIPLILLGVLLFVSELGFRLATPPRTRRASNTTNSVLHGGLLTFLALLLTFTLSMAERRYEARSEIMIDEVSALGSAYMRTRLLLDEDAGETIRGLLRDYVDARIQFYEDGSDAQALDAGRRKEHVLQREIWRRTAAIGRNDPNSVRTGMLVTAIDTAFDDREKETTAFERHVPNSIIALLLAVSTAINLYVGYRVGIGGRRTPAATVLYSLLVVITMYVILDLNRPRGGLIITGPGSVVRLRQSMTP